MVQSRQYSSLMKMALTNCLLVALASGGCSGNEPKNEPVLDQKAKGEVHFELSEIVKDIEAEVVRDGLFLCGQETGLPDNFNFKHELERIMRLKGKKTEYNLEEYFGLLPSDFVIEEDSNVRMRIYPSNLNDFDKDIFLSKDKSLFGDDPRMSCNPLGCNKKEDVRFVFYNDALYKINIRILREKDYPFRRQFDQIAHKEAKGEWSCGDLDIKLKKIKGGVQVASIVYRPIAQKTPGYQRSVD